MVSTRPRVSLVESSFSQLSVTRPSAAAAKPAITRSASQSGSAWVQSRLSAITASRAAKAA